MHDIGASTRLGRVTGLAMAAIIDLVGGGLGTVVTPTQAAFLGKNGPVAFVSNRVTASNPEGDSGILSINPENPDGTGLKRLNFNAARDIDPVWSVDGVRIAFDSDRDGHVKICSLRANGAAPTRHTAAAVFDGPPDW